MINAVKKATRGYDSMADMRMFDKGVNKTNYTPVNMFFTAFSWAVSNGFSGPT